MRRRSEAHGAIAAIAALEEEEVAIRAAVCSTFAHNTVTTMLYIQSLLGGQPLDEASYRAVLVGCNLAGVRYDVGAVFVEEGLAKLHKITTVSALTDGQIAIARADEVRANESDHMRVKNGEENGKKKKIR